MDPKLQICFDVMHAEYMALSPVNNGYIRRSVKKYRAAGIEHLETDPDPWLTLKDLRAAVEHIELKLKAYIPGTVMVPEFPMKPYWWTCSGKDDPYDGQWTGVIERPPEEVKTLKIED